jgi:hypothetical protein
MDQNAMGTIDPKLREAYERVMGTTVAPKPPVAQPATQPPPMQQAPAPVQQPTQQQPVQPTAQPIQPQTIEKQVMDMFDVVPPAPVPQQPPMQQAAPTQPPMQQQQMPVNQNRGATLASLDTTPATEMHAYVADEVAGAKQNIKTIQMIYIAGGIIFFAVYALFWMKFFAVASPL